MLLILLSWIYITVITAIIGVSINKSFKIFTSNNAIIVLLGLFGISLLTGFWAIWFIVNWEFHVTLVLITLILSRLNGLYIKSFFENLKKEIKTLSFFFKAILGIIAVLIIAQCASPPFIIDNESYYIQTIKWINEYGYVKGLINLHLFLGQTSGWHVLQSAFSFSFLYENFNDLSGFVLLLGNYFAISRLDNYFKFKTNITDLVVGLFPVFNLLLFQFISAPSPDIAVYVITLICSYLFLNTNKENTTTTTIKTISILSFFAIFIKLTALVLLIFPLIIFIKYYNAKFNGLRLIGGFGLITIIALILKNLIITGNPIYPLKSITSLNMAWALPEHIELYFKNYGKAYAYNMSLEAFNSANTIQKLKSWLLQSSINDLFNGIYILLLLFFPFLIYFKKLNKKMAYIYIIAILQMVLLFYVAPEYRFFLGFFIILNLVLLGSLVTSEKILKPLLLVSVIIAAVPLFIPVNMSRITSTEAHQKSSVFSFNNIISPNSSSRYSNTATPVKVGNTTINSPINIDFFWGTGNTKLPALNKAQLDYFKETFKVIPQQYSKSIKDGFYSMPIND